MSYVREIAIRAISDRIGCGLQEAAQMLKSVRKVVAVKEDVLYGSLTVCEDGSEWKYSHLHRKWVMVIPPLPDPYVTEEEDIPESGKSSGSIDQIDDGEPRNC